MNRRLNVLAIRAVWAVAVAMTALGCAQLEGDAGPTVVVPGPDDRRDRIAPRHRRPDDRHHRHDQGRHGRELHLHQRRSHHRHRRRRGRRHRRRARRDLGDHHRRRLAGDRRLPDLRRRRAPTRSPTTTPGRCRRTPTRPRSPSTTGTRTARSRPPAPAATARRGSSTTSGGDGSARGRRRQARADEVGDPLRHLPQPGRRRAVVGDVSLGRHRRRAGRRGALHDLPPGAIVGPRRRRRDRRRRARHRRHRQRGAQLPEHPLLPGRRHAVRRAREGRLPVRGPGLRRPLPPRRRLRHLHRLSRPAHDAGQVRRLRRLPHRRHRRRRRAPDPDDVVGRHRLRRRRQHQRGDLRRARRPARQAGRGDPDLRFGARRADLLRRQQLSVLVRRRRPRRQLLDRRGGDLQRVRELDRRACCAPPTTTSWPARIRARSPTTRSTSSSCSTTRSPTSTARWSPRST